MTLLRALFGLSLAVALQSGLGRLWPETYRFVDFLLVPVVWYGIVGSQRRAMLFGCTAGLAQDAWFQVAAFGTNGFKKTLLGWALGGLSSRLNLNQGGGRLAAGALVSVADDLLSLALRRLLDQPLQPPGLLELAVKAAATGLLVALAGNILDRWGGGRSSTYAA